MVDNDHTHKPNQAEIDAVVQMFACQGYTLNVEISDAIPHYDVLVRDPSCLVFFEYSGEDNSFGRTKANYFDHALVPGWHYCIFGHDYEGANCQVTGSSGLAENPGNDLVVTLGQFSNQVGTPFDRAATLAHEFGHNLGLTHCGSNDPGDLLSGSCNTVGPYLPNIASIMSYFYQLSGLRSNLLCQGLAFNEAVLFKEIDYSHGTMCTLNEAALDEPFGSGMMSVDWNCSGNISGIRAHDLFGDSNGWCNANSSLQQVSDMDEWASISTFLATAADTDFTNMPMVACITAHEVERVVAGGCPQPVLTTETCENRGTIYLDGNAGPNGSGKCSEPFRDVQSAHNAAPDGSVLFFRSGSYTQPGPIVLTKPLKLFSVPTASQATTVIQPP